jgi:hypothetical protein
MKKTAFWGVAPCGLDVVDLCVNEGIPQKAVFFIIV